MHERIKVLLADDHPLLAIGLKMVISEWDEFDVVGIASDGEEAVSLCEALQPDLVIMDMQMPRLSGPEAITQIKTAYPNIRILALTTFDDSKTVSQAMESGCDGFLLKVIEPEKLRASLLSVAGGMGVYDEEVMDQLRRKIAPKSELRFTKREQEILSYVSQGMTNAEIARQLSLRPGTVKNLISLLLSKTNCISRAQLVKFAAENQLVE
jgi:DNA-binding NarL/FixJ family response regulator